MVCDFDTGCFKLWIHNAVLLVPVTMKQSLHDRRTINCDQTEVIEVVYTYSWHYGHFQHDITYMLGRDKSFTLSFAFHHCITKHSFVSWSMDEI